MLNRTLIYYLFVTATKAVGKDAIAAEATTYWSARRSDLFYLNWLKNLLQYWYEKNIADAWKPIPIRGETVPKMRKKIPL